MVSQSTVTAVTAVSAGAACFLGYMAIRHYLQRRWTKVGKLRLIYLHPVKSTRGLSVDWAVADDSGFHQNNLMDRQFMVVTTELDRHDCHKMATIRAHPKMLFLEGEKKDTQTLKLKQLDSKDITKTVDVLAVNLMDVAAAAKVLRLSMWADQIVEALDCGDEAAAWVSEAIGVSSRLVWQNADLVQPRIINFDHSKDCLIAKPRYNIKTSLSDLSHHMLANDASLADLNSRMDAAQPEFTMRHFRPTLVVATEDGSVAFDEDNWDCIRIGKTQFTNVKPCTRCSMPSFHPTTGEKHPNDEPLKTLRKYRLGFGPKAAKIEQYSPRFGINLDLDVAGKLAVGDDVFVLYR